MHRPYPQQRYRDQQIAWGVIVDRMMIVQGLKTMKRRHVFLWLLLVFVVATTLSQWRRTGDSLPGVVTFLDVHDSALYACTTTSGVFRSSNNGEAWTALNSGLPDLTVYSLCFKGSMMFAANGSHGVSVSTNNGGSWSNASSGLTGMDVRSIATDGTILYAGTFFGGIYRSIDNGSSWVAINTGLITAVPVYCLAVIPDIDGAGGNSIFAGSGLGAYRSRDVGDNWSYVPSGLTSPWPTTIVYDYAARLTADSSHAIDIFAVTNGGYFRSTDYGEHWQPVNTGLTTESPSSIQAGAVGLFAGTFGGAFVSMDEGTHWTRRNTGLTDTLITRLTRKGSMLFAGTLNGSVWVHSLVMAIPESLAFESVPKDSSASLTVTVMNLSADTVGVDRMTTNTSPFQVGARMRTLEPDDTMHVQVGFTPATYGRRWDTLSISGTAELRTDIPLTGDSPPPLLGLGSTAVMFGPVALGDTVRGNCVLFNRSIANPLTVSSLQHRSSEFIIEASAPFVVKARDSVILHVRFSSTDIPPSQFGTLADTLRVTSDGGDRSVILLGYSPRPMLVVDQNFLDFTPVGVGDSLSRSLHITNTSPNTLKIDSLWCVGTLFKPVPKPLLVHAGDTATVRIVFTAPLAGSYRDTLFLRSNAENSLVCVPLTGYSPLGQLGAISYGLSFPNVPRDSTATQALRFMNWSVTTVRIDSLATRTKYFSVAHGLDVATIKQGETTAVEITFVPDSAKTYRDTLFVWNDGSTSPYMVPLMGSGIVLSAGEGGGSLPAAFSLGQNYPNPFNPMTMIRYGLPSRSHVTLTVFNTLGQQVSVLQNGEQDTGYHDVQFNAAELPSGVYYYRLQAGNYTEAKKLLLIR
jgi:hypothetical protein